MKHAMKNSSEKITNCIKIRNVLNEMHSSDDVARLTCYFCQNKIRDEKKRSWKEEPKRFRGNLVGLCTWVTLLRGTRWIFHDRLCNTDRPCWKRGNLLVGAQVAKSLRVWLAKNSGVAATNRLSGCSRFPSLGVARYTSSEDYISIPPFGWIKATCWLISSLRFHESHTQTNKIERFLAIGQSHVEN